MANMICCELKFNTILRKRPLWQGHYAGVVDQNINLPRICKHLFGGLSDGFLGREIHMQSTIGYCWKLGFQFVDYCLNFLGCAACKDEKAGRLLGECSRCCTTDSSRRDAGNQDDLALNGRGKG